MPKERRVFEYIEWTTIPYRTVRFWIIVILAVAFGVGLWFINKYGIAVGGKSGDNQPEILEKRAAQFTYVDGDVKVKPLDSLEWVSADKVDRLYPGDLVRTGSNSSCRVVFFDGTLYEVKPNSLVSILESYENPANLSRSVNVELATGALDLSTYQKNAPGSKTKVETANTVADVGSYTRASATYDDKLNDTGLKVSQGQAAVTSKDTRESVVVRGNESLNVKGGAMQKQSLPPGPVLLAPITSEIFSTRDPERLNIRLQWRVGNATHSYRVSISNHPQFYQKLFERVVAGKDSLTVSGLAYGNYYWRVSAIDANNVEGYPSATSMFGIRPQKVNPSESIRFDLKEIVVIGNILEVIGQTDPDNFLTINGKMVILDKDGTFKHFTDPFAKGSDARLQIEIKDYSGAVRRIVKTIKMD
jgi:hypothetical protein